MSNFKVIMLVVAIVICTNIDASAQFPADIVVTGTNGTIDGAQVNRDYQFTAFPNSNCWVVNFEVVNQNSTSFYLESGNQIVLVWKPSYVGTTQQIKVDCICEMGILNLKVPFSRTQSYTLHL